MRELPPPLSPKRFSETTIIWSWKPSSDLGRLARKDATHQTTTLAGTTNRGTNSASCKLTEEQVLFVYESNLPDKYLATALNVSRRSIRSIKKGEKWGWLTQKDKPT
jgi:hypothetical protein